MENVIEQAAFFSRLPAACLRRIVEQAPIGVAVLVGPDLIYEFVNPYYQAFAPSYEMLGRPFAEVHWEMPEVAARLKDVWETGRPWHAENLPLSIERAPGNTLEPTNFTITCIKVDRHPLPDAVLGFVLETTAQVELARGAHQRATELETIIDTMLEGVVVFDGKRRVTLINQAARALLNLAGASPTTLESAHEVVDGLAGQLPSGKPLDPSALPVSRALAGESSRTTLQFFNQVTQRTSFVSVGAAPLHDIENNIVGAVSVGSDVTGLTELDRLKDDFIRLIAHELKTPITVLKGYATVLGETLAPSLSGEHRRMLQAINRNTDRLGRLLAELLDAQQIELGRLEIVKEQTDLASLIEDVVDHVASKSPKHRVRVVATRPIVVIADGERLREVMRILLDNAVRYSPAGGDVDVALTIAGGQAEVTVRDQGVGIPRDRQARIFERFYRAHVGTEHDYGGTGLGLYVASTIIARHGGAMTFTSEEGNGSTFTFRLPLARAEAHA